MNTNIVAQATGVGGWMSVFSPSKRDAFINKYHTEILMVFILVLFAITTGLLSYRIIQLKSIASGIFIKANYEKIINGQLTTRDFKIMQDINMSTDDIFKQKQDFDDRY